MWQSGKMKKLRRILAGWLCVILVVSLNISSLADKGGQISEIIPTLSSEDKAETEAPSEKAGELFAEAETTPIETDSDGEPKEENKSSVILHTPSNLGNTEQDRESDTSGDQADEATPSDADEDLINDLIDNDATPSDATPADADLIWSVEELQKRIDALPAVSELEGEELGDYLLEVYREVADIREAVESLSGDEQALLDVEKLEALETFFAEEYPAVFAAEYGEPVETGVYSGREEYTLYYTLYKKTSENTDEDEYTFEIFWTGNNQKYNIMGYPYDIMKDWTYPVTRIIFPQDGDITIGGSTMLPYNMIKKLTEVVIPDSVIKMDIRMLSSDKGPSMLTSLTLPASVEIVADFGYYSYNPKNLKELVFTEGRSDRRGSIVAKAYKNASITQLIFPDAMQTIGDEAFYGNQPLEKLDLGKVETIGAGAFQNCPLLRNVVIPNSVTQIGSKAFSGGGIEHLEFRAASDEIIADDTFSLGTRATVTVGKETKALAGNLFKSMTGGTVLFEGENEIAISGMPEGFPIVALADLNGVYYADQQGVLYTADRKTLVYCPPGITSYTVPGTVEVVGNDAFRQASNLTSLTFEAPDKILRLENRAFYDSRKLQQINEKSNVEDIKGLFTKCSFMGYQLFTNTALEGVLQSGTLQTDTLEITRNNGDARLRLGFEQGTTTVVEPDHFVNLTGDPSRVSVQADGPNTEQYVYRIYLEPSETDCIFGMDLDVPTELGQEGSTVSVTRKNSAVEGVYYLEFWLDEGKTVSFTIPPVYPSPSSKGGALTIWGDVLTLADAEILGNKVTGSDGTYYCQMTEWVTERNGFGVEKKAGVDMNNGLTLVGDGTEQGDLSVSVKGGGAEISYNVNLTLDQPGGNQATNLGKDFVQRIQGQDTLLLPAGMHWQEEILDAVRMGDYYTRTVAVGSIEYLYYYANVDGKPKEVANLQYKTPYRDAAAYDMRVVDEELVICWDLLNPDKDRQEISTGNLTLNINGECLRVARGEPGYQWDEEQILGSRVIYTVQYAYSESQTIEGSSELLIAPPRSDFTINKTPSGHFNTSRGNERPFTITLTNPEALVFSSLTRLEDSEMPNDWYIRPEDIARMFREKTVGEWLEMTIKHACLYEEMYLGTATAVDGISTVPVTAANSSLGTIKSEDAALVFAWDAGSLKLNVYYNGSVQGTPDESYTIDLTEGSNSVQEALDSAGYVVTYFAEYDMEWNLEGHLLYGGQVWTFPIYASLKDTFQFLQAPYRERANFPEKLGPNRATAWFSEDGKELFKTADSTGSNYITHDYSIYKGFLVNGEPEKTDEGIYMGDVIDYKLSFSKVGTGTNSSLPLIDYMTGPQQLMVPVEDNADAIWAEGLNTEEIGGNAYYILTADGGDGGIYKHVWVGVDENGDKLCADSVEVGWKENTFQTVITWYYHDMGTATYHKQVTYQVLLALPPGNKQEPQGGAYWISNEDRINGRPDDYLYDTVGLFVTLYRFSKEILTTPPGEQPEETAVHTVVARDNKVTYKLRIDLVSNVTDSITLTDAKDVLPRTWEKFDWDEGNVEISYADGEGNPIDQYFPWEINMTNSVGEVDSSGKNNIYFTIQWDSITIPLNDLIIYVTLAFPEDVEIWDSYVVANQARYLYNRFYIADEERRVTHELATMGRAYLQKGVYWIGHYSAEDYSGGNISRIYRPTNTRTHYINEDGSSPNVIYYIQVYNGGLTRLYLTEIQDILPRGFTLGEKLTGYGILFGNGPSKDGLGGGYYSDTISSGAANVLDSSGKKLQKTVGAEVMVTTSEDSGSGRQKLVFTFGEAEESLPSGVKKISYDETRGLYYLEKGEAVSFAYLCDVGYSDETDKYALNRAAMPYLDYNGGGVIAEKSVKGEARSTDLRQNAGLCSLINEDEALLEGFSTPDSMEAQEWLSSEVTLERGAIIPGVTKAAETYTPPGGLETNYVNGVDQSDQVNWGIYMLNNGQVPMVDYTFKDTMEYPYTFMGDVRFTSKTGSGDNWMRIAEDRPLFSIGDRVEEDNGNTMIPITGTRVVNPGRYEQGKEIETLTVDVPLGNSASDAVWTEVPSAVNYYSSDVSFDTSFQLRFYRENNREVMEVRMNSTRFSILSGGQAELMVSTINESGQKPYKIYINQVLQKPSQVYDEKLVSQGEAVKDETGLNAGIRNSAQIVVTGAYATSSINAVEETDMPTGTTNRTDSTQPVNYILLPDEKKDILYTLTVINDNRNKYSIGGMTFIDNLPQVGDHPPFSEEVGRGSQFRVSLAEQPDVQVEVESKDGTTRTVLAPELYEVTYSGRTEFETADWEGSGDSWDKAPDADTRSLRLRILDTEDEDLIPEGAKVHVSFRAKIDGEAAPGAIAWNSFGYYYHMLQSSTVKLMSAPLKVGIQVPEVPMIEKHLSSADGQEHIAGADEKFRFLIHNGDPIAELDYNDENAVLTKLSQAEAVSFTIVTVEVKQGDSSGSVVLNGLSQWGVESQEDGTLQWQEKQDESWNWTNLGQYTVAELKPDGEYDFVSLNDQEKNGVGFSHRDDTAILLNCENRYPGWSILVKKVDSKVHTTLLPGAIFAFYSPEAEDKIEEDNPAYAALPEKDKPLMVYEEFSSDGSQLRYWYLADIRTTGDSGTIVFSGLSQDEYRIREVKAPNGYIISDAGYIPAVKPNRQDGNTDPLVLTISVKNTSAFVLPKTGGTGTLPVNLAGILCLCYSGFLYKKKRAGAVSKKKKEEKGNERF